MESLGFHVNEEMKMSWLNGSRAGFGRMVSKRFGKRKGDLPCTRNGLLPGD